MVRSTVAVMLNLEDRELLPEFSTHLLRIRKKLRLMMHEDKSSDLRFVGFKKRT